MQENTNIQDVAIPNETKDNEPEQSKEDFVNNSKGAKKRKNHYFEHHIKKIMKVVCPNRNMTQEAKSQLNEIVIILCKIVIEKVRSVVDFLKKKTILINDLECVIKLIFSGQLSQKSVEQGHLCVESYLNSKKMKQNCGSKQNRANVLIPPSIVEKILRDGCSINIASLSPIFLAGVVEYFLSQVVESADNASRNGQIRLNSDDIQNGIKSDEELDDFFVTNKIYIFGTYSVPYNHPKYKNQEDKTEKDKKSIKIISKIQKEKEYVFTKTMFENKFKNNINLLFPEMRFQKSCFLVLQEYIEKYMINILQYANMLTILGGKSRVNGEDIDMVLSIMENKIPEFLLKIEKESLVPPSNVIVLDSPQS